MFSFARLLAVRAGALALVTPMLVVGVVPASAAAAGHVMMPAVDASAAYESMGTLEEAGATPFSCQKTTPPTCFGPDQIRAAYDVQSVLDKGITGAGRTIVVIDAFQSPTLHKDLAAFDALWKIAAPPSLTVVAPDGLTPFNIQDPNQVNWSLEISIDVEWAHAIAPGAAITLVLAKSSDDADMLSVTNYAVRHNLGDVISQSFGEAEMCASRGLIRNEHRVFANAIEKGISLFASSGDQGAARPTCDGKGLVMSASTPASDPSVTGVGGTHLVADGSTGTYVSEAAWSRSGGGFSTIYRRPEYQEALNTNKQRGVPDVAFVADSTSGLIVAWSVLFPPNKVGLGRVGGTSIGSASWAAIVTLLDQARGERLGAINPRLYGAAKGNAKGGLRDVLTGNNSFMGIVGFSASAGWDPITGLGTPSVTGLVARLGAKEGESEGESEADTQVQEGGHSGGD